MNYTRSALPMLLAAFFYTDLSGQSLPGGPSLLRPYKPAPPDAVQYQSPPIHRWSFSLNPLGFLEPEPAVGAGIGYRMNKNMEIWSETSLIRDWGGWVPAAYNLMGIRQILQLKYFFGQNKEYFMAGELRYRSFSMNSHDDLYDQATGNTLSDSPFRLRTYFFGAALQLGARFRLFRKSSRYWVEATAGIGVKQKTVILGKIPAGYKLVNSIDLNVLDFETTPGTLPYFPGSLRFIYLFGKRLP